MYLSKKHYLMLHSALPAGDGHYQALTVGNSGETPHRGFAIQWSPPLSVGGHDSSYIKEVSFDICRGPWQRLESGQCLGMRSWRTPRR